MRISTNLKKKFSLMLVLVLVIALFAGCGKKDNGPTDNVVSNDNEQTKNAEDNNAADNDKDSDDIDPLPEGEKNIATLPDFDIEEDKVVKVIAWWVHPKVGDPDMDLWPQEDRLLKQLYDVDIEYIKMPAGEVPTKHAAMVMAGDPADVVNLQSWADYPYSFTNGLYEPLDDLLPLEHEVFDPVRNLIDELRVNEKAYWAVTIVRPAPPNLLYNKTLIEEAGLEDPWELVKRNEWTWDTFFNYCKELTVDRDGDGNPDQYGAAVIRSFLNDFPRTLGYSVSKIDENKNIEINLRDEGLMAFYEFLKKVGPFGEGVFHPLSFKQGDALQKMQEDFINGNIAMYYTWDDPINLGNPLRPMLLNGEIALTILPRYPKADKQYIPVSLAGLGIAKGAKHPQAAAAYITLRIGSYYDSCAEAVEDEDRIATVKEKELGVDLLSLYKGEYELTKADIYGALYAQELPISALDSVGRQKYIRINYQKQYPERVVFDFGQFAGLTNYIEFETVFSGDQNGNPVTAQQVIEKITPQMQEKIDKFEKAIKGES